jgi:hypothetical protein
VLEEQKALEMLNVFMEELENGNTTPYRRVRKAYEVWKKKSFIAHITLLSSMNDDIM